MSSAIYFGSSSEHDPYLLSSPYEIRRIFRRILEDGLLIRMQSHGNNASVITSLLELDWDDQRLTIDHASHDHINRGLLEAGPATFETSVDQVKIQFATNEIESCLFETKPALSIPLPETIRRLQRREHFRVYVPVSNPATCLLTLGRAFTIFNLHDISAGGAALIDTELSFDFRIAMILPACTLQLPGYGSLNINLQVTRLQEHQLASGRKVRHVGTSFLQLSGSAQTQLQNYRSKLERSLIARKRGLD